MARYVKHAAVVARALRWSEMWPARMPPNTPPTSNNVDKMPAVEFDRYWPFMAVKLEDGLSLEG